MSGVVRIGSIIICHQSKRWKAKFFIHMWCNISGEAAGEIWSWSLLGVKGLTLASHSIKLFYVLLVHTFVIDHNIISRNPSTESYIIVQYISSPNKIPQLLMVPVIILQASFKATYSETYGGKITFPTFQISKNFQGKHAPGPPKHLAHRIEPPLHRILDSSHQNPSLLKTTHLP